MRTTRKLEFNRINEDKNILSNLKDDTGVNSLVQNSSSTNVASAAQAFAIGLGTKAGYTNQFVMGKFNINKDKNLFEIGFGSDNAHRRNILELNQDGALTAQYVGITGDGLRFYNNSSNGELGINLTTLETPAGRTAIKKFIFYDGTGDTSKKAEIEAKTLTAASCSIANAPIKDTDVIRKQEYDSLFSGTATVYITEKLGKNIGYIKIDASSDDDYILPYTVDNLPKFMLGSDKRKFKAMWSELFNGDLNGTATRATYASADTTKGTIEERLTNLGFRQLLSDKSSTPAVSGAGLFGTLTIKGKSASGIGNTTREGNRTRLLLNLSLSTSTYPSGSMLDFFTGKEATCPVGFVPKEYRPASTSTGKFGFYVGYRYNNGLSFRAYIAVGCTVHIDGSVTLKAFSPTLSGVSTTLSSITVEAISMPTVLDMGYQSNPL